MPPGIIKLNKIWKNLGPSSQILPAPQPPFLIFNMLNMQESFVESYVFEIPWDITQQILNARNASCTLQHFEKGGWGAEGKSQILPYVSLIPRGIPQHVKVSHLQ